MENIIVGATKQNSLASLAKSELSQAPTLKDEERTPCEVWSRVMGYHRATSDWNAGKVSEWEEREFFVEDTKKSNDRPVSLHG